jgi:hypothetical protein
VQLGFPRYGANSGYFGIHSITSSAIEDVRLLSKAHISFHGRNVRFGPIRHSIYHLIGKLKELRGNAKPKFFCRFHIDDQLELGRLLHRQIRWLSSLEDFVHV